MKSIIFVSLLVAAIAIPLADAQLPLPTVIIDGTVFCSVDASVPGTILTPFPNATVELQCSGLLGALNSTITTTGTGTFSILLNNTITVNLDPSQIVRSCGVVVTTPLANCNANLVALPGFLTSSLTLVSSVPSLIIFVANLFALP